MPTERPPLVDEVSANFCEQKVPRGQRYESPRPYSRLSRSPDPLFLRKSGRAENRTRTSGSVARNSDR
jgi:hypothetical protein